MSQSCSCPGEALLCNCAAQIAMANFDVSNNERQASSQGSSGSGPLDIPHQTSSSPSHSPKNSPRPTIKKETPKSDKSSCREVSPSQLEKPECLGSISRSSESIAVPQQPELMRSTSQISQASKTSGDGKDGKERKESRSSDRTKKKSSWYHALTPTYKSRSEEFKKYFKDMPADERLIVDYSCAVQKDLLIQGRLYVTQNFLCFYAIYFRWETCIAIRWKDVTAVTKEKTALIIPNAIMVSTESEKHFFTTFNTRDKAYVTLFRVWQNALMDKPLSMKETWSWVHEAYGAELGLSSDDEYYEHTAGILDEKTVPVNPRLSADSLSEDARGISATAELGSSAADSSLTHTKSSSVSPPSGMADENPSSPLVPLPSPGERKKKLDHLPTDQSDNTESDIESNIPAEPLQCPTQHDGRCFVNLVLPIHVDQLFTLLFTNSKFFLEFHALRRTTNIQVTSWQPNTETGEKIRTVSMVVSVSQTIGPRSSNVQETQVMKACSKPGQLYVIEGDVVNSGIPYADSFYVDTHYCLVRTGDHETSLTIYAQLKYKKTVWQFIKNVIEKSTWSGLDEFYDSLNKSLQAECGDSSAKGRPHRRRSRVTGKAVLLPVQEIAAAQSRAGSIHKNGIDGERRNDYLVTVVLAVLLFLLLINTLLYYKLWFLEEWAKSSKNNLSQLDLEVLRNPPKTHDEWLELFRQQETLHRAELARWQAVLQAAVRLLRRAEEALSGLQGVGHPTDEL